MTPPDCPRRSTSVEDFYDAIAPFLDLAFGGDAHEPAFLLEVLGPPRGAVLELGVGTGRVTLELARAGWEVVGVEASARLLEIARGKATGAGLDSSVQLLQGSAAEPGLGRRFDQALAVGLFFHLDPPQGYLQVLRAVYRLLQPGGRFVFDVECRADGGWGGDGQVRLLACRGEGELHAALYMASLRQDEAQRQRAVFAIERSDDQGRVVDRRVLHQASSWVRLDQLEVMCASAGFVVERTWGDWRGSPHTAASPELIVLARRPRA